MASQWMNVNPPPMHTTRDARIRIDRVLEGNFGSVPRIL